MRNPQSVNGNSGWYDAGGPGRNLDRLLGVGLAFALALFFASFMPAELVAPVMREALYFGALGAIVAATLRREKLFENHVTSWDQAAMLYLGSLVCGFLVDEQAALAKLAELAGTGTGAAL